MRAAYATLADVELIDVSGARRRTRARADLESRDVDAIDICLPSAGSSPASRSPPSSSGKHVFCETPMALALDEALAMRDAARKAERLLQVGLLMRSVAGYRHIKDLADAGTHGRLLSLLDLAAGLLPPAGRARSQVALQRSDDRADDLRPRFRRAG